MKLFKNTLLFLFIATNVNAIDTKAENAIVLDYATDQVLFEKNADERVPPASMTKIMTVYAAFDRIINTDLSIENTCVISPTAYNMGGSRTFLEIDDSVTLEGLLKGVIIQSGNDASVALAECLAGTESDFAILMNYYAEKIGMNNTNFLNASGWPEQNHYSTVRDLAILSNKLINDFPNLYSYFKLKEFTYNGISQPNRNRLLSNIEGVDGIKTGYTKKSGWGISASSKRQNRRITVVINGTNSSRSRLNESSNLINWAFSQTKEKKLLHKDQVIKNVDTWLGDKPTINLIVDSDVISILSFDQQKLIKSSITYNNPINAPVKKGEKLGFIEINISGKKKLVIPLVAEKNINNINPFFRIFAAFKYLLFGTSLDQV